MRDAIFADVTQILADFHGQDFLGAIGPETRFFADLGLASIDTVVLGETLEHHYGRTLPFADLMADLGQRKDRDLSIGELVAFLHRHLGQAS
ncbi:MAG: phosphopantetheine-binding protein [Isosphaeraceae bacterium]|nr:phosphopantetheine-binding protein [Isosphaeraceae bacterium]